MKLKQLASINAGYPFRGKIPEVAGSSVVVVQMKDASPADGIRWSSCLETRLTGKRQPDYLSPGDILVAARGNHNYAVSVDHTLVTTGKQAVAAPHFFVISLKTKDVLPEFMVWLFNQGPVQRYFEQNAEGTLTKSIRRSVLEDAPVVIPPLAKQRAILGMAKTLAEEQKLVQTLISNGERMMATIAKDLFNSV
ncbi:restriction endonuclease subunit S [Saccharophagus sp. K07]|uniref:restriction endonuclease subunit S n=1 Tax=Saccharophagus sp. K07 TaxID=2283636 RepID=UPI001651D0CA|nr:restriction endonuclease subunit S [Saccharophagus sp. K07]MBC6906090.1 restriction endonuclease subunit S [Saccharophagus sp. K07]